MTFSYTQPLVVQGATDAELDPLYEAWNLVRDSRRVPLEAGVAAWAREVGDHLERVHDAIALHVLTMESSDSPLMRSLDGDPVRSAAVQLELAEHAQLGTEARELLGRVRGENLESGEVFALAERLIELEISLARHLNRLHEIVGSPELEKPRSIA